MKLVYFRNSSRAEFIEVLFYIDLFQAKDSPSKFVVPETIYQFLE